VASDELQQDRQTRNDQGQANRKSGPIEEKHGVTSVESGVDDTDSNGSDKPLNIDFIVQ